MQTHMDMRISNIEKIFVTTVAPLVETLDILVRQVRYSPHKHHRCKNACCVFTMEQGV